MDWILIVRKREHFHFVLQEGDEDFNVAMCGTEVTVEDPEYLINYDRDFLTTDKVCWDCIDALAGVSARMRRK